CDCDRHPTPPRKHRCLTGSGMCSRLGVLSCHGPMTATLEQVIEALRNELQQYGEMLALLEAQQDIVSRREPHSVLKSISAVEAQNTAIETARRQREVSQRQLAWALGRVEGESFPQLLSSIP